MNIGPLDSRITIQRKVIEKDPVYRTDKVTWQPLAPPVWANVQDVLPSRDESIVQGSIEVKKQRTRIRIRWRSDIDSSMRIVIASPRARTLQIIGGPSDIGGRRNFMEMLCEEISSQ